MKLLNYISTFAILMSWTTIGCMYTNSKLDSIYRVPLFKMFPIRVFCYISGFVLPICPLRTLFPGIEFYWLFIINAICTPISSNLMTHLMMFLFDIGHPKGTYYLFEKTYEAKIASRLGRFFLYSAAASIIIISLFFVYS